MKRKVVFGNNNRGSITRGTDVMDDFVHSNYTPPILLFPAWVHEKCPEGLEELFLTDSVFLKPYSGPHVVGHMSKNNTCELLDHLGKRIFMMSNHFRKRSLDVGKTKVKTNATDAAAKKQLHSIYMPVLNYLDKEAFRFYGTPGKIIKVGIDKKPPWGIVRRVGKRSCPCSCSTYARYDVTIFEEDTNESEGAHPTYIVEGKKTWSCWPTANTKKLYFGTFLLGIYKARRSKGTVVAEAEPMGRVWSQSYCTGVGLTFPGIEFPKELNLHHKAVLMGVLMVDLARRW